MVSLLTLLDDVAATLDDVAIMTKVAMKKTSALMTDDLAVNAGVVHGVRPDRELPIVKSIFYGSLLNKVYAISGVLILMAVFPPAIKAVLFVGGLYLSYEGAHKVHEKLFTKKEAVKEARKQVPEKDRIKGAVRTDLILSIEIIVIAESSLTGTYLNQVISLIVIGLLASIIIYGLVAVLVKVDDLGLWLIEKKGQKRLGNILVQSMPYMMKGLGVLGTTAMFMVGGGIIMHLFHFPYFIFSFAQDLFVGLMVGAICLSLLSLIPKKSA